MLHIVHMIERRNGERASPSAARLRSLALSASAIATSVGLALAFSHAATAQDTVTQSMPLEQSAPAESMPAATTTETPESAEFDAAKEAGSVLDAMDAGDFAAVHARFDATMAAAVSVEQLRQIWSTLPTQVGTAQGRGEAQIESRDGLRMTRIPLRYERAELLAIFAFAADGRIAGFAIRPATGPGQAQNAATPAAYAAPPLPADAKFSEREIVVGDAANGLGATLALPIGKGPFPAVVLVHGSGPQDRDETIGPNRPFLDLARGLAERGVAVLRYDKRSKARPQDYAEGIDIDRETTDDAVLALATARGQAKIDPKRIFVLGHSQGGMMAARIAQRSAEKGTPVAGVVLLAAPSRPLLDIMIEQTRRMAVLDDGKTSPEESAAIADIGRRVAAVRRGGEVAAADTPGGLPAGYWRSVEAVDPVAEARALTQPMLILQGGTDIQVVDADWQGWKAAFHSTPRVTFKLYETLNHLAIPGTGTIAEYQTPGQVDAGLIADIAIWIGQQRARAKK